MVNFAELKTNMPIKTLDGIVLSDYIAAALGNVANRVSIPRYIADKIIAADPQEELCHIEWPNPENGLTAPHLWRIDDWRTSYTRHVRKKELEIRSRTIEVRASELRIKFVRSLMLKTGTEEAVCQSLAAVFIKSRNIEGAMFFGIDLTELLEADDELQSFKSLNNIK